MTAHSGRAHAKLSASGAERWVTCPGSVALSEGIADRDNVYSREGTLAHEVLEHILKTELAENSVTTADVTVHDRLISTPGVNPEMVAHCWKTADFILGLQRRTPGAELLVEKKVSLGFIDPDMWGTYDGAVVELFGTLHVVDFKYGAGHVVSPIENLQEIFYGLGLAHRYDWNFQRVRLWIIQPRVQGFDGPAYWDISIQELRRYVEFFRRAVQRVKEEPTTYVEGRHCYYCRGESKCPLKVESKLAEGKKIFSRVNK